MTKYFKRIHTERVIELAEKTQDCWLSLKKELNILGDCQFTIFKVPHDDSLYNSAEHLVWWKNSKY